MPTLTRRDLRWLRIRDWLLMPRERILRVLAVALPIGAGIATVFVWILRELGEL